MKEYRLKQIEQYISEKETVSLEELCESFNVSINTIRRDIVELLKQGSIDKIYGGVRAKKKSPLLPFEERHTSHMDQKERIGERAAMLVEDGDVIYIDSGTTTFQMIPFLQDRKRVTIITNSLNAILKALPYKNLTILITNGQLERMTNSFVGINPLRELGNYHIKRAFMAATGLSLTAGATNSMLLESEIKQRVVQKSEQKILMIDSSKFGFASLTTYAQIADFNTIVTDQLPSAEYADHCRKAGVEILLAE